MRNKRKAIEQPTHSNPTKRGRSRLATKEDLVQLAQQADRTIELWRRGPPENWWIPDETKDAVLKVKLIEADWEYLHEELRLVPEGVWEHAAKTPSENCRIIVEGYMRQYCPPIPDHILAAADGDPQDERLRHFVVAGIVHDDQLDHHIQRLEEADGRRDQGLRRELSFRVSPWTEEKLKDRARYLKLKHTRQEQGHNRVARLLITDMLRWIRAQRAKEAIN